MKASAMATSIRIGIEFGFGNENENEEDNGDGREGRSECRHHRDHSATKILKINFNQNNKHTNFGRNDGQTNLDTSIWLACPELWRLRLMFIN